MPVASISRAWTQFLVAFATVTFFAAIPALASQDIEADVGGSKRCDAGVTQKLSRPESEMGATPVSVGFYVVDIMHIDTRRQTFTIDFLLSVKWRDPRFSGRTGACRMPLEQVWNPALTMVRSRDLRKRFGDFIEYDGDGNAQYTQRLVGEVSARLDVREFPLDEQTLQLRIVSSRYGSDEVKLIVDPASDVNLDLTLVGWNLRQAKTAKSTLQVVYFQSAFDAADFDVVLKRDGWTFFIRILGPLSLIALLSAVSFWIKPIELGPRLSISLLSLLNFLAYQFSLTTWMPDVAYLTLGDKYILMSLALVFLVAPLTVLTWSIAANGDIDRATRLNRTARWAHPLVYVSATLTIFIF